MTFVEKLHSELKKAEKQGDTARWNLIAKKVAAYESLIADKALSPDDEEGDND